MTWDSPRTSVKSPLWPVKWAPVERTPLFEACWSVPCTWPCSACASAPFIQKELFSVVEHHTILFVNHNSTQCRNFRFLELLTLEAGSTYCHTRPLKAIFPLHLHGVLNTSLKAGAFLSQIRATNLKLETSPWPASFTAKTYWKLECCCSKPLRNVTHSRDLACKRHRNGWACCEVKQQSHSCS